jgi:shikimate kinase
MTSVPPLRIALIGLMGAGKSLLGPRLARTLGWPFVDADRLIEAEAGQSVAAIFAAESEAGFRQREAAVLDGLARRPPPFVAALGGGVVLGETNRTLLSRHFYTVWLRVDAEEAWRRLGGAEGRPLLAGDDPLGALRRLETARASLYADVARLVLDTGPDTEPEALCGAVTAALAGLR